MLIRTGYHQNNTNGGSAYFLTDGKGDINLEYAWLNGTNVTDSAKWYVESAYVLT